MLWLITKPPSSLWASGLSCAGVGVGGGKKLLYLRLSMECFLNLSFPCAVRVDFNWVLTIIGFALFRIVIGPETMRHCVNQSDAKLKLITTWSPIFSRALGSLFGFTLSSHWLFRLFSFFLIGCCDFFGVDFTTLCREALYCDFRLWYTIFYN